MKHWRNAARQNGVFLHSGIYMLPGSKAALLTLG